MALMKCHECGYEVSSEAKACPKCGAKVKKPRISWIPSKTSGGKTSLVVKLFAALVGLSAFSVFLAKNETTHSGGATTTAEKTTVKLDCAKTIPEINTDVDMGPGSGETYIVNVAFIGKRPTNKQADSALRKCLVEAIKRDGTKDISASPWFRANVGANPLDDALLHPYGEFHFLAYTASTKKTELRKLQKMH